jgi:hypothetical protein
VGEQAQLLHGLLDRLEIALGLGLLPSQPLLALWALALLAFLVSLLVSLLIWVRVGHGFLLLCGFSSLFRSRG